MTAKQRNYCVDLRHAPVWDDNVEQWRCLHCGHCLVVATRMDVEGGEDSRVLIHTEGWQTAMEKNEYGVRWARAHLAVERLMEYESLLGQDTTWPIIGVIEQLTAAVDHLLIDHQCDQHGHEVVQWARKAAEVQAWRGRLP